jgi:hypothetical protein
VQSDKNLNGGLNVDTFVGLTRQRGIFLSTDYPLPVITHTPLVNQIGDGPYVVTATVTSELTETVTAVELRYGVNGAPDQIVPMTPTGTPNEYSAGIPTQSGNVTVNYFLVATNTAGNKATHPRPAPCGGTHSFQVQNAAAVGAPAGRPGVQLGPAQPNPSSGSASLGYSLPASGPVRLIIYGIRGDRVRTLVNGWQNAGSHVAFWDGRADDGRLVPAGVYACRIEAAGARVVRSLVRLH